MGVFNINIYEKLPNEPCQSHINFSSSTWRRRSEWLNSYFRISCFFLLSFTTLHRGKYSNLTLFSYPIFFFFFLSGFSFTNIHESQDCRGRGRGIFYYHFHPLHRHLDISRAITAESSPLHIASSRTRTGNFWFPSASR